MEKEKGCPKKNCGGAKIFAYLALLYIIACIIYLAMTRSIGTPFGDAIKKYPNLVEIKTNSSIIRRNIFYIGIVIGIVIILIFRPF